MENFNYYIRKFFTLKLVVIFIFLSCIAISILGDLKLFLDYRQLKQEYSNLEETNIKNKETEDTIKALKEYNETYIALDKSLLEKQINDIEDFEYDRLCFSETKNIIGFKSNDSSEIEVYSKQLNEKGYDVNVISVEKRLGQVYFEMEVR